MWRVLSFQFPCLVVFRSVIVIFYWIVHPVLEQPNGGSVAYYFHIEGRLELSQVEKDRYRVYTIKRGRFNLRDQHLERLDEILKHWIVETQRFVSDEIGALVHIVTKLAFNQGHMYNPRLRGGFGGFVLSIKSKGSDAEFSVNVGWFSQIGSDLSLLLLTRLPIDYIWGYLVQASGVLRRTVVDNEVPLRTLNWIGHFLPNVKANVWENWYPNSVGLQDCWEDQLGRVWSARILFHQVVGWVTVVLPLYNIT